MRWILCSLCLVVTALAPATAFAKPVRIEIRLTKGTAEVDPALVRTALAGVKGVVTVHDVTKENASVTYDDSKTGLPNLRSAIRKLGYSADGVAPDAARK